MDFHTLCRATVDRWEGVLKEKVPAIREMSLAADKTPLPEELNVAWAGALRLSFCGLYLVMLYLDMRHVVHTQMTAMTCQHYFCRSRNHF